MDPISILGGVGTALALVQSVCEIVQWMQKVYDSMKNSSRILKMIRLECNIYGDSIKSIGTWLKENQSTKGLQKQLRTTHNAITLVKVSMANLQRDLKTIGSGQEKLSIKSFKNCIRVRHQWFEETMKTHLTELRCHSQTLQLTLQVIQLTKPSELPTAQAERAPEKLEQKTRSLEKRLLLRHFLTKALAIRRAEAAAEEERRCQAMKEFIRIPPLSSPIQPSIPAEDQTTAPNLGSVVEQVRQKALAEQENISEDLLLNNDEDLIDFSSDFQIIPLQAQTTELRGYQDLHGLRDLELPKQAPYDIVDQAKINSSDQLNVFDQSFEQKHLQAPQFASQPPTPGSSIPESDAQRQVADNMIKPEPPGSRQVTSQFAAFSPSMADGDARSIASGYTYDASPISTATPSIFSHASTLSSAFGSSVSGITEAELRERDSKIQTLPKRSSYSISPSQTVRQLAVMPHSSESLEQSNLGNSNTTLSTVRSSAENTDAELTASAMSQAPTADAKMPIALESLARSMSEDVTHRLDSTIGLPLQDINKPDGEGFPWIVQAARDGDEIRVKRLIISGADLEAVHVTTKRSALCEASLQGHSNVVGLLVHEGCLVEHVDAQSYTALHHACHKGYLAVVKTLVAANADIEALGPQKQTPLHLAAQVPHKNVVMLLQQRNANVNARDENYQTPLHISAAQGNVELCSYLLENGAQLDSRDSKSKTALQLACEAGHYDVAEAMLKSSNLRATDLTFLTAFFAAVEHGHIRTAESFLAEGLDLQKLNKNDVYKPATLAAKSGSPAMLELMIREKCNVKAKDDNDWNALHFATRYGHWQLIEPLIANDVSVKAVTKAKDTPLILAVKNGHFAATEILLRSKGVSVTVEDGKAQQPIHHAARAGLFEIFNLLISHGAKVAVENAFGWHPIHVAVAYGHATLVDRLIEQSAKVEEKLGSSSFKKEHIHKMVEDGYWAEARLPYPGSRPLHLACEYGHYQIAANMISRGAKLEAACSEGWRPLHHAAFDGSSSLVALLLSANCYPLAETEEGHTPLTLQFRTAGSPIPQEEKDKVRLLLQAAADRTTKQPGAKGLKVGLKKGRTVEEKQNVIRAATFSMEMTAKSPEQSTQTFRPRNWYPPMPHSNTFPSALPSVGNPIHAAQIAQPPQSPLPDRPESSSSNRPATSLSSEAVPKITSSIASLSNVSSNEPNEEKHEPKLKTPTSDTAVTKRSATTVARQQSMNAVQALPGLPLSLMKNKLQLKRASTFSGEISKQGLEKMSSGLGSSKQGLEKMSSYSLDVSKQGLEKMSHGLGSSKQGLEKMSSYSLDVSKHGYRKMSSYGQNVSKQGLEKMKKINYGQNVSKQGLEKMKKMSLSRKKKDGKGDADDGSGGNDGASTMASTISGGLPSLSEDAREDQSAEKSNGKARGDEDLPYHSDGAESVGAFSMGGFEAYDDGAHGNDHLGGADFDEGGS